MQTLLLSGKIALDVVLVSLLLTLSICSQGFTYFMFQEVEEKAPLLMKQKEDYEHARNTVESMSIKLEENIKVW